jgi:predicted small metal-binding protein
MGEETITVRCACGWETAGPEDAVVAETVEHGRQMHNMVPTRDDVLAMAVATTDAGTSEEG